MKTSDCDLVILAGGQGTRIKHLLPEGQPKCMSDINGQPFLKILMDRVQAMQFGNVMFSLGYGAEEMVVFLSKYQAGWVTEAKPLGTGGALRNVMQHYALTNPFLVMNADTYFGDLDFEHILREHEYNRPLITSAKYDDKFVGVFAADWRMRDFLEWEHREKFDMADLPLHAHSKILCVKTPFLDIGTPEGLAQARMRFK